MASSVIRGAWYVPDRQELNLLFVSGRRYIYSDVPLTIANGFAEAPSKGRFYNDRIRNRFACREVGKRRRRSFRSADQTSDRSATNGTGRTPERSFRD